MDDPGGVGSIALAGAQHLIPIRKKLEPSPYTLFRYEIIRIEPTSVRSYTKKSNVWCVRWIHLSHKGEYNKNLTYFSGHIFASSSWTFNFWDNYGLGESPHPLWFEKRCCPLFSFESQYRITVIKFEKSVHPYFCLNSIIELRSSSSKKKCPPLFLLEFHYRITVNKFE